MLRGVRRLGCSLPTLRNRLRRLPRITRLKISQGEFRQIGEVSVYGGTEILGSVSMKIVDGVIEVTINE